MAGPDTDGLGGWGDGPDARATSTRSGSAAESQRRERWLSLVARWRCVEVPASRLIVADPIQGLPNTHLLLRFEGVSSFDLDPSITAALKRGGENVGILIILVHYSQASSALTLSPQLCSLQRLTTNAIHVRVDHAVWATVAHFW